jgi:hypothetical protein
MVWANMRSRPIARMQLCTYSQYALWILLAFTNAACVSAGLYTTPRALAKGSAAGGIAVESAGRFVDDTEPKVTPYLWGSAQGRMGVGGHVDLGFSINLPPPIFIFSGAVDAKVQVADSGPLDFALMLRGSVVAPFITAGYMGSCSTHYCRKNPVFLHAELIPMFGINFARDFTLVLAPGIRALLTNDPGFNVRATVGLQWRMTDNLAIHPEFTYMPKSLPLPIDATQGFYGGVAFIVRGRDGFAKDKQVIRTEEQR